MLHKSIALFSSGSCAVKHEDYDKTIAFFEKELSTALIHQEDLYKYTSPQRRADILLEYIANPSIDILWAFRGGEGSADVIPFLEKHADTIKLAKPKLIIGFSDITALLIYFSQRFAWPVIHGPGAFQYCANLDEISKANVLQLLNQEYKTALLTDLNPLNTAAKNYQHNNEFYLTGGNLSLLSISVKDEWELNATNKWIVVEEVDEKAHVVLRNLKYLKRVGIFDKARGLILGAMTHYDANIESRIDRGLQYFADEMELPVFRSRQFGHHAANHPLPFYLPVKLDKNYLVLC